MELRAEIGQDERKPSPFTPQEVLAIAQRRGWLAAGQDEITSPISESLQAERLAWLAQAAQLLGVQAADAKALEGLLEEVFQYDAGASLARPENQAVMAREGARQVLRELASLVLDSAAIDSDRYKEVVAALKERTRRRGQELFHPVRLALAGRAGEGEHDRVILLLDGAARLPWAVGVKNCRDRILEFCAAFD
ncbi:MAG TPA: hypothetical protein VKG84_01795 [Candidatus Acidoferrales bacterium]|nr:hypothetical protein [Candidatus Acidoferrales bacterium]